MHKAKNRTTLAPRTCRMCGKVFSGGPRAWYCPHCRAERAAECSRRHKANKRAGKTRRLGEEYRCEVCGKLYVLINPNQKYCPECAPEAVKAVDAGQSLDYYREHTTNINDRRRETRQAEERPCVWCGKLFSGRPHKKTCSEHCAKCTERFRQQRADAKRYGNPEPQTVAPPKNLDWEGIDWSLSAKEIAILTGRKIKTVYAARKRLCGAR